MSKVKVGDTVRVIADNLATVLINALGKGRHASYVGTVIEQRNGRVLVALEGQQLWFDAEVITANVTMPFDGVQ